MKQHITKDQIEQLNDRGKRRYKKLQKEFGWLDSQMVWLNDKVYFLTIGQMIEFLMDNRGKKKFSTSIGESGTQPTGFDIMLPDIDKETPTGKGDDGRILIVWHRGWEWKKGEIVGEADCGELCDALWIACKEILNK